MQVHPEHVARQALELRARVAPLALRRHEVAAHQVKEEGARATRGVERPFLEGRRRRGLDDLLRQPVRCVVFAELLADLGGDDRLVEHLQDVVLDGAPIEAREPAREAAHEGLALGHIHHPVEEVGLDDAVDAGLVELLPREDRARREGLGREAEDRVRDDLGGVHEERVLHEELVGVLELRAERGLQQARPEPALGPHDGVVAMLLVEAGEARPIERVRAARDAQPSCDLLWRRANVTRRREDAFEPDQERVDVGLGAAEGQRRPDLVQIVLTEVVAVRRRP